MACVSNYTHTNVKDEIADFNKQITPPILPSLASYVMSIADVK